MSKYVWEDDKMSNTNKVIDLAYYSNKPMPSDISQSQSNALKDLEFLKYYGKKEEQK